MTESNTGHGHVYPRPDRVKVRCGGPRICNVCALDAAKKAEQEEEAATEVESLRGLVRANMRVIANLLAENSHLRDAADRIDQLELWKTDAVTLLDGWDRVWEAAGKPGLGRPKHESTLEHIERLHAVLWSMAANRTPRHPDDTHVEVFMPVDVWAEFRP